MNSGVRVKVEPYDHEEPHCALLKETLHHKRNHNAQGTASLRKDDFGQANQQQPPQACADKYPIRDCDVMPKLIPIQNSRSFVQTTSQKESQRTASDSDPGLLCSVSSHPEVFTPAGDLASVVEMNRKLSTVIANQNKIISQNEMILSKLNSSIGGSKSQRIEHLDSILQGKHRNLGQRVRNEMIEERIDKRKDLTSNIKNGRSSSSSLLSSEGGSSFIQSETDVGQPPGCKLRRTSDSMCSVGSARSKSVSPARDAHLAPSRTQISNSFTSASAPSFSSGSSIPVQRSVATNPYNMAVYVLRADEPPPMLPVLPIQYSKMKSVSQQTDAGSSMLSSHPALIYNPETRHYEASYVTGIAHSTVNTHVENTDVMQGHRDASRDASRAASSSATEKSVNYVGREKLHQMQPSITNVVSLRRDSLETQNAVISTSTEVTSEGRGSTFSSVAQHDGFSNPTSPIVIEEDVKPSNLQSQEELLHIQLRSFSMRNYAVQLMRALFRPHEIMHRSVYENGERKGLDRKRLQQIKDYVFQIYPTPNKEKSLVWIDCVAAMNEAIRSMK